MAETLGEVDTLPSVVGAMVPDVADWAVVHLVADHGGITRAALAHRDPQMHAEIERQHQDRMFNPDLPYGPANVIRTGTPMFVGRVSSDFVTAAWLIPVTSMNTRVVPCLSLVSSLLMIGGIDKTCFFASSSTG